MFDVSALLSLKPAGPAIDPAMLAGAEAQQNNPFSAILNIQIEGQAAPEAAPAEGPLPGLVALATVAGPAAKRQPDGKILPDALPLAGEPTVEDATPKEAPPINPLNALIASRLELQAPRKGHKPAEEKAPTTEAAAAETAEPDTPVAAEAEGLVPTLATVQPTIVAVPLPAAANSAPSSETEGEPALAPAPQRNAAVPRTAMKAPTAEQPAVTAAPQGKPAISAAALAAIGLPQPVTASTAAPAMPALTPAPMSAAAQPAIPAPVLPAASASTLAMVAAAQVQFTAPVETQIPAPTSIQPGSSKPAEAVVTIAAQGLPLTAPAAEQQVAIAAKPQRAQPASARRSEDKAIAVALPTGVPAETSANEATTAAAPVTAAQPTTLLAEARQPVVMPAATPAAAPTQAETPQDFAAIVDRLIAARQTAGAHGVQASISHAEFGRVSLDFRQDDGALTVAMKSADPGFAPAVLAAMTADKSAPTAVDAVQQTQAQVQAVAQAQAGSQAQMQNQGQPQQQQSQQQSHGSNGQSAQMQQDGSGQRGADGSQGRDGQNRGTRYQQNPSSSGRDTGSAQSRKGTYA